MKRDSQEDGDVLRERMEELVGENSALRRAERELKINLETKEMELGRMYVRETELNEHVNQMHEDYVEVEAKRSQLEYMFSEVSKEAEKLDAMNLNLRAENDDYKQIIDIQSKISKAYELLLSTISQKFVSLNIQREINLDIREYLRVPKIDLPGFNDDQQREVFLNKLCFFEDCMKEIGDYLGKLFKEKHSWGKKIDQKEVQMDRLETEVQKISREVTNFLGVQKEGQDLSNDYDFLNVKGLERTALLYKDLVEKLKMTVAECFRIFEDALENPTRVKELVEVFMEYYDTRVELERHELEAEEAERTLERTKVI
jgi:hypothetical protein